MRSRVVTLLVALGALLAVVVTQQLGSRSPSGPAASGPAPSTTTPAATKAHATARPTAHPSHHGSSVAAAPLPVPPVAALPPAPTARYTAAPVPTPHDAGPGTVPLRLNFVSGAPRLEAPGLAVSRGTIAVSSGSPAQFDTDPLRRPVTLDGASQLRLHLTHSASGDLALQVTVGDVLPDGSEHVLASQVANVAASVAAAGPKSNVDLTLGTPHVTLPAGHVFRLTVGLADTTLDQVTLYYGALPGEDEGNTTQDQLGAADGGPNPARLTVPVTEQTGAFGPY